jgi:hypothetical protein
VNGRYALFMPDCEGNVEEPLHVAGGERLR